MELPTHVLLMYGYLLLFVWVLAEQLGIPLPATPVLLAAGALSADGPFSFSVAFAAGLVAAITADSVWFLIGRRYGHHVLRILCKLSMEPTTCVRRTQDSFGRRRGRVLIVAKFIPGLGLLTPPVAGQNGMAFGPFLLYDGIGAALWVGVLLAVGRFFGDLLKRDLYLLNWAGRFSGALLVLGIAGFFLGRVWRRRMVLKKLTAARLEPEDLKRMLDAGEEVFIVDLRHPLELLPDPFTLPGAQHISPEALAARHQEIPARPRHRALLHLPQRSYRCKNRHDAAQPGHRSRAPPARRLRRVEAAGFPARSSETDCFGLTGDWYSQLLKEPVSRPYLSIFLIYSQSPTSMIAMAMRQMPSPMRRWLRSTIASLPAFSLRRRSSCRLEYPDRPGRLEAMDGDARLGESIARLILVEPSFADFHAGRLGKTQSLVGVLDGLVQLSEVGQDRCAARDRNGRPARGSCMQTPPGPVPSMASEGMWMP